MYNAGSEKKWMVNLRIRSSYFQIVLFVYRWVMNVTVSIYVANKFLFMQLFSACSATSFIFLNWQCKVCANYMHAIQITFSYNMKNSYAPPNAVCINQSSIMLSMFLQAMGTKKIPIYHVFILLIPIKYDLSGSHSGLLKGTFHKHTCC
jgi:hypothetical protein